MEFVFEGDLSWQKESLCARPEFQNLDFFPERTHLKNLIRQGSLCARCPVRDDCVDYARGTGVSFGIWGGFLVGDGGGNWWRRLPVIQEDRTKASVRTPKKTTL